jgi:hypothetical protein
VYNVNSESKDDYIAIIRGEDGMWGDEWISIPARIYFPFETLFISLEDRVTCVIRMLVAVCLILTRVDELMRGSTEVSRGREREYERRGGCVAHIAVRSSLVRR